MYSIAGVFNGAPDILVTEDGTDREWRVSLADCIGFHWDGRLEHVSIRVSRPCLGNDVVEVSVEGGTTPGSRKFRLSYGTPVGIPVC